MLTAMTAAHKTIYLKDYTPFPYRVVSLDLDFDLREGRTRVTARSIYHRHSPDLRQQILGESRKDWIALESPRIKSGTIQAMTLEPLYLNGEDLELVSIAVNGEALAPPDYTQDDKGLTIHAPPAGEFTLEIVTQIAPETNTRLEGLYMSGGNYCTQCEAEGFRRITYFPDRPDVMTVYNVRVEADRKKFPVLLSNGNLVDKGEKGERHFTVWSDPFPKPCYLFALVAGDLTSVRDVFTTRSGRKVDLYIYVRPGDESQCAHAMESLKKSMTWDEEVYGLEYDLDLFNIVAVSDFNMGAMENKSLNIFNTALVLAQQDTATDSDFINVESVIAHEYFHNWSGNRVTCRDWFQLSLKEGLTVFRDQEFSADMHSRTVQRIDDVQRLRRYQFPEDAGPLSHPVRPESYIEINNFYTLTVYEKGAEVIRMMRTILGAENYRKGTDLYFARHDGQAVTCEDFVRCMEDASGADLTQFRLWYAQAGTPAVTFKGAYDAARKTYTLTLTQATSGKPMHIPVVAGLVGAKGDVVPQAVLHLKKPSEDFVFEGVNERPVPSVLRELSAPVRLSGDLSDGDLRFLMVHDTDRFNRYDAAQRYFLKVLKAGGDDGFLDVYGSLLDAALAPDADKAFMARMISLPDIPIIAQEYDVVDPQAIYTAREALLNGIVDRFGGKLDAIYAANAPAKDFSVSAAAMGRRVLRNTVFLIGANRLTAEDATQVRVHYNNANTMTDRMAALYLACALDGAVHDEILGDFYTRFENYPLVIDKWFSAQAQIALPKTLDVVRNLRAHKAFNIRNPNRARSLFAAFGMNNPVRFHAPDGSGHEFLADAVIELNTVNPQIAARLLTPFKEWRRYTPALQASMRAQLERIAATPKLSPDVFEIVSKSLEKKG